MNSLLADLLRPPGNGEACSGPTNPAFCYDTGQEEGEVCLCAGTGAAAAPAYTAAIQGPGKAGTEGMLGWEHWDGSQEPIQSVFPSSLRNGWWHRHHFGETLL